MSLYVHDVTFDPPSHPFRIGVRLLGFDGSCVCVCLVSAIRSRGDATFMCNGVSWKLCVCCLHLVVHPVQNGALSSVQLF